MDKLNLTLVRVSIDIGLLTKQLILKCGASTSYDNEDGSSLHGLRVITCCSARYALVLTCAHAFHDYYYGENVSTKQLVQYYQSKE